MNTHLLLGTFFALALPLHAQEHDLKFEHFSAAVFISHKPPRTTHDISSPARARR
jgi:hypothetical protein